MGYAEATPETEAEVLKHLTALGKEGGTYLDIFDMSESLGEKRVREGLLTLERKGRAVRQARHAGHRGRDPDLWRAVQEES